MRAALIIMATAGVGWLIFSAMTVSIVCDSLRCQRRRFSIGDLAAIAAGPLFWLACLVELSSTAIEATPITESDPVKPDYQPGDEIAVFAPFNRNEVA